MMNVFGFFSLDVLFYILLFLNDMDNFLSGIIKYTIIKSKNKRVEFCWETAILNSELTFSIQGTPTGGMFQF